jgi:drug/metabolite transporter superfamily protein YnfA
MKRTFVVTLAFGAILAFLGVIWGLQGFGVLLGSPMSNTTTWSVIGPITAVVGVAIAVFSWRRLAAK